MSPSPRETLGNPHSTCVRRPTSALSGEPSTGYKRTLVVSPLPRSDAHTDMRSRLLSHKGLRCVIVVVAATLTYARRPAAGSPAPCPTHDRRKRALYTVCVWRIGNMHAVTHAACGVFEHRQSADTPACIASLLTRLARACLRDPYM